MDAPPPPYGADGPMNEPPGYTYDARYVAEGALGPPGPNATAAEMQRRYQAWLSQDGGLNIAGATYEGVRVLHMGDSVIGLWQRQGTGEPQQVALKQTQRERDPEQSLLNEYNLLRELNYGLPQKHVLRVYKHQEDVGQNTLLQDVGSIEQLIFEYAPGRSLLEWQKHKLANRIRPTEVELWEIFHCLARAILVMLTGGEDPNYRPRGDEQLSDVVHFDLDQSAVLLSDPIEDEEHEGAANVYKLGSFRRAIKDRPERWHRAGAGSSVDAAYHDRYHDRGPVNCMAPEQLRSARMGGATRPWLTNKKITHRSNHGNRVNSLRMDSLTNVWKAALIMYCLANNTTEIDWSKMELINTADSRIETKAGTGLTFGTKADIFDMKNNRSQTYSRTLMRTIRQCLSIQHIRRPNAYSLFAITRDGLKQARAAAPPALQNQVPQPPPAPVNPPDRPPVAPPPYGAPAAIPTGHPRPVGRPPHIMPRRPVGQEQGRPPPASNPPPPYQPPREPGRSDPPRQTIPRRPVPGRSDPPRQTIPRRPVPVRSHPAVAPSSPQFHHPRPVRTAGILRARSREILGHRVGGSIRSRASRQDMAEELRQLGLDEEEEDAAEEPPPGGLPRYNELPPYHDPILEERADDHLPDAPSPPPPRSVSPVEQYDPPHDPPPFAPPIYPEPPEAPVRRYPTPLPPLPGQGHQQPQPYVGPPAAAAAGQIQRRGRVRGERPARFGAIEIPRGIQAGNPTVDVISRLTNALVCCVLENELFRLQSATVYLTDIPPNETWFNVKRRLVDLGVRIPANDMRLRYDKVVSEPTLLDEGLRSEVAAVAWILVDNPNVMDMDQGLEFS